jgi:hypothetical protein
MALALKIRPPITGQIFSVEAMISVEARRSLAE